MPGTQGRLQQGGMEMQQTPPIRRRTLGEDGDVAPLVEEGGNFLIDDFCMTAAATAQEYRIVLRRQPADQRPGPDLRLGDEGRRQPGIDDVDVDPRDVIRDDQRTGNRVGQIGLDLDPEGIEQRAGPTRLQAQLGSCTADRKNQQSDDDAADDQQDQAENPEGAKRKIGFVQSACPK